MPEGPFGFPRLTAKGPFTKYSPPRPEFATHATDLEHLESIYNDGEILATEAWTSGHIEEQVVSMSLGGAHPLGDVMFVFPLDKLKSKYSISPDFYYSLHQVAGSIQRENFRVVSWDWWSVNSEIQIKENVDLSDATGVVLRKGKYTRPDEVRAELKKLGANIINMPHSELKSEFLDPAQEVTTGDPYEGAIYQSVPPQGKAKDMTLAYNRMVADEFGVSLDKVERIVEEKYNDAGVGVWW